MASERIVKVIDKSQSNPLHDCLSYNYRLRLYMLAPTVVGTDLASVTANASMTPDAGFYLIAQSGGASPESRAPALQGTSPSEERPFAGLEFFIDDVSITTAVNAKQTDDAAIPTSFNFKFKISEPFGMSFLMALRDSHEEIKKAHPVRGSDKTNSLFLNQVYGLRIDFIGYDSEGKLMDLQSTVAPIFYTLRIVNMKHRLDGKMSAYDVSAAAYSYSQGLGQLADVKTNVTPAGKTYKEWAENFIEQLNQVQQKLTNELLETIKDQAAKTKTPIEDYSVDTVSFAVEFDGFDDLANSTFVIDKSKAGVGRNTPMSHGNRKTSQTTDKASAASGAKTVDQKTFTLSVPAGDKITKAFTTAAAKTTFMQKALTVAPTTSVTNSDPVFVPGSNAKMTWMSVTPVVTIKSYDTARNSYAVQVKFIIRPYKVAYCKDPDVKNLYSPTLYRKYEYYYTGKNLDVKSFELNFNATYFLTGTDRPPENPFSIGIPIVAGKRAPGTNSAGDQSMAAPAQTMKKVIADLTDPSAAMNAKMSIFGDPGYLIRDPSAPVATSSSVAANPTLGMIFIQVKFKVATDYDLNTGVLDVTNNLRFDKYAENPTAPQDGMLFIVNTVTSTFANGTFMQELQVIPMFNVSTETGKEGVSE